MYHIDQIWFMVHFHVTDSRKTFKCRLKDITFIQAYHKIQQNSCLDMQHWKSPESWKDFKCTLNIVSLSSSTVRHNIWKITLSRYRKLHWPFFIALNFPAWFFSTKIIIHENAFEMGSVKRQPSWLDLNESMNLQMIGLYVYMCACVYVHIVSVILYR